MYKKVEKETIKQILKWSENKGIDKSPAQLIKSISRTDCLPIKSFDDFSNQSGQGKSILRQILTCYLNSNDFVKEEV